MPASVRLSELWLDHHIGLENLHKGLIARLQRHFFVLLFFSVDLFALATIPTTRDRFCPPGSTLSTRRPGQFGPVPHRGFLRPIQ